MTKLIVFFLIGFTGYGQMITVKLVEESLTPLIHAEVQTSDGNLLGYSNVDGFFEYKGSLSDTLVVSYIGLETTIIVVKNHKVQRIIFNDSATGFHYSKWKTWVWKRTKMKREKNLYKEAYRKGIFN